MMALLRDEMMFSHHVEVGPTGAHVCEILWGSSHPRLRTTAVTRVHLPDAARPLLFWSVSTLSTCCRVLRARRWALTAASAGALGPQHRGRPP